jgi:hypothetical protein
MFSSHCQVCSFSSFLFISSSYHFFLSYFVSRYVYCVLTPQYTIVCLLCHASGNPCCCEQWIQGAGRVQEMTGEDDREERMRGTSTWWGPEQHILSFGPQVCFFSVSFLFYPLTICFHILGCKLQATTLNTHHHEPLLTEWWIP